MSIDLTKSIDRSNLDEYAGSQLTSMLDYVQQQKQEGKDSVRYPWYVPNNRMKHLDGFKRFVFTGLIAEGIHVTDFLPGGRPEIGGFIREILICWTDQAKAAAESDGLVFKTY